MKKRGKDEKKVEEKEEFAEREFKVIMECFIFIIFLLYFYYIFILLVEKEIIKYLYLEEFGGYLVYRW